MKSWKNFPRFILSLTLLTGLLAGVSAPNVESVSAAPMAAVLPGDVVISEFRFLGPAGGNDEFIELYNPKNVPVDLTGLKIMGSSSAPATSMRATLGSVTLLPGQYYLLVNSAASPGLLALQNATYVTGITPDGGIAIALNDGTTIIDAVGLSATSAYKEGTNLAPLAGAANQSYERKGGGCADTVNNSTDFVLRNPSNPQNIASPAVLCADFSLTMIVDNATPSVGTNVKFTITVTNSGPNDATNVTVRDLLPVGLTYVSNDLGAAYTSGTGIWEVGNLINGASATINITATVTTGGAKTNWAEVWSADQIDSDSIAGNASTTEDDDASAVVTAPAPTLILNITNTVNNPNPNIGSNVVFTITVSNPNANATGVVVNSLPLLLPAGLIYISHSTTSGTTYANGSGVWTIGNLAGGATATLNVTARVATSGTKNYSAVVSSNEFANSTAVATVNPVGSTQADLSLSQIWSRSTTTADRADLKITVTNQDTVNTATNVQVKDLLPSGLDYVSHTAVMTYSSTTGIWAVGTLAPSTSSTLNITVKVSASGTSTNNFAEVWTSDQYDPVSTNNSGSMEVGVSDLSLSQRVDLSAPTAIFTLTVSNSGPDDATDITVKNSKLATSYNYVSHGSTLGTYNTATGDWTIPTLLDGASATLTVTTTFTGEPLVNWAQVTNVKEVDPDSLPNNCTNSINSCTEDDDAGAPAADLFLTQSVNNANPDVGTNVVFAITVGNAGVATTNNVQVKDLLPSGLTYVSDDSGDAYVKSTGLWTVGSLANGATRTLKITVKVAAIGIRTNWAEVWKSDEADPDSTPGNGSTTEDDDASATITSYRSIIINEVAWAGTASGLSNDEWIELYNPSNASINITGWTLKSTSGSLDVTLSGTIASGGYFLLERDDNNTVSDVTADQIYTASLSELLNAGEVLTLRDNLSNFIDTANGNGGAWPKGSSSTYGTMERVGTSAESDSAWKTNTGTQKNGLNANNGVILGTPRKANSASSSPALTASIPTNIPTRTPTIIPPVGRPILNEILARPGFDWNQDGKMDVFDEFIEIKNVGNGDMNMQGWKLDDEANLGSSPFTLPSVILKPGQNMVFYGLQTNILLSDGGDTVRLLNSAGTIFDAYTYPIAMVEDASSCRVPDNNAFGTWVFGTWFEDCTPTPNLSNTRDGVVPSMPGEGFESPICALPDTLPADFLFAECRGYGANIWDSFYWDKDGWQGDQFVPENMSKWESFVE